jgi:hypothetical protein
MSELSLRKRLENAYGSQQVENVKAHHAYTHGRADNIGEWGKFWSRSPEATWAHAFGRMRTFEQVWGGNVAEYDAKAYRNYLAIWKNYPEVTGKDPRPILENSVHTLVTDIIEVAEDGMSARGSFVTPGLISSHMTYYGAPYCMVLWERYGSDFVNEDGEWKYLHEQVCPDIGGELDHTNWGMDAYKKELGLIQPEPRDPDDPYAAGLPPLTDLGPLHHDYSLLQPPQDTVPWPEPYKKMDNDNTYSLFVTGEDPRFV